MDNQRIYNLKSNHTRIQCECGISYSKSNKLRHFKTKRHKEFNPAGELESVLQEIEDKWEAKKTSESEAQLQQFIKDYETVSIPRLKALMEAKKEIGGDI